MTNQWGLDVDYVRNKLSVVLRDLVYYTPQELQRELTRIIEATKLQGENE